MSMKSIGLVLVLACVGGLSSAADKPPFGRSNMLIVTDPVLEPVVQQVLAHMPEKKLAQQAEVRKLEMLKAVNKFCRGGGAQYPDIVAVPREMTASERKLCQQRTPDIIRLEIGYEALVMVAGRHGKPPRPDTRQLFLALARDVPDPDAPIPGSLQANPATSWVDVGLDMKTPIKVLGPAIDSRDGRLVKQLAMETGCRQWPWIAEMKYSQRNRRVYREICHRIMSDGRYVSMKTSDDIVTALRKQQSAIGLLPFNDWMRYSKDLQAIAVDGLLPTLDNISRGLYPMARSYHVYIKRSALSQVPGVEHFLKALASDEALAAGGYLHKNADLVVMPDEERKRQVAQAGEWKTKPLP